MNNISHTLASSAQRKKNIFDRQGEQVRMGRRDLLSQETVLRLGTLGLSSASGSDFCRILHTQGCADLCLVTCPHQHGWGQHIHLQQLEELLGTTWSLRVTCLEAQLCQAGGFHSRCSAASAGQCADTVGNKQTKINLTTLPACGSPEVKAPR